MSFLLPNAEDYFTRAEVVKKLVEFKERRKIMTKFIVDNTLEAFEAHGGEKEIYIKCCLKNLVNTFDSVLMNYAIDTRNFDIKFEKHFTIKIILLKKQCVLGSVGFMFECFNHRFIFNTEDGIGFDCSKIN